MMTTHFSKEFSHPETINSPEESARYEQRLIELAEEQYRLKHQLGEGQSAEVWFGVAPEFEQDLCFKTMKTSQFEKNSLATQFSLHELFRQVGVRVPRLIAYMPGTKSETFGTEGLLAMERIPGRTLEEELTYRKKSGIKFSRQEMMGIIHDASAQIERAHEQRLYHRDLHLNNVMLTPEGEIVIIDFGKAYQALGSEDELTIYQESAIQDGHQKRIGYKADESFIQSFSKEVLSNNLLDTQS